MDSLPNGHRSPKPLRLKDCWAKTDKSGRPCITVEEHSIHVGMVGMTVCEFLPGILKEQLPNGVGLLIAGHDAGKISAGFQLKCPEWRERWQETLQLDTPEIYEGNHALLSQAIFAGRSNKPSRWLMALGGHHGRYFAAGTRPVTRLDGAAEIFNPIREELLARLGNHFGGSVPEELIEKGARLHWFTGLVIFSDWIGSNTTWFSANVRGVDEAQSTARRALDEIGWHRRDVQTTLGFSDLFGLTSPRPLQSALTNAANCRGLYIVEAPMGDGKTEASLAAAYRRWSKGEERGLYFALPTQLTSNRIHDRVLSFLSQAVADDSAMALVHGKAWLTERRILPLPTSETDRNLDQAQDANRWFADTRRSMLAPFGVGTVDQALMSVLSVKFSALRMFALAGKVVVIDEVHSYDPYTSAIVDRAVAWLLELKCSVIVLSATLTARRRAGLVAAAGAKEAIASKAYPLITKVAIGSQLAEHIEIMGEAQPEKEVRVEMRPTQDPRWMDEVARAAESGACVLIIRNTVALAQEAWRMLRERCRDTGIKFGLIHSRFTQIDRDTNESSWMEALGASAASRPENGAILVGTQVLEQSVDIDADLMITDLAPTDLVFQRMGRLHRHLRRRPAGCESPRCIILEPPVDWNAEAASLKEMLAPHHFIYPPFSLFMAHRVWSNREWVRLPSHIRELLEASDAVPPDLPAGVDELLGDMNALVDKQLQTALRNGPFGDPAVQDVEGAQTRWQIEPSGHLILLDGKPQQFGFEIQVEFPGGQSERFISGIFSFPLAKQLHRHVIRVPLYLVREMLPHQPEWLTMHFKSAVIATLDETGQCAPCFPNECPSHTFSYRSDTGLTHRKILNSKNPIGHDDESWF